MARRQHRTLLLAVMMFACGGAEARAIDEVRVSRVGEEATIEIELGCVMRYDGHSPLDSNRDLRIQLTLGNDCHLALHMSRSDQRHPVGGRMANLFEIAFDADARDQAVITLRFDRSVTYRISQTANLYMLTVVVGPGALAMPSPPPPVPAAAEVVAVPDAAPPPEHRAPLRQVRTLPSAAPDRFVIRIAELTASPGIDDQALRKFPTRVFYAYEIPFGARPFTELRMGFFDTEEEASRALAALGSTMGSAFGPAWIAVADPEEQLLAREHRIEPSKAAGESGPGLAAAADENANRSTTPLSEAEIASMMSDGRSALLRGDYPASIGPYSRALQESGPHRQEALEFLGVAWEKGGQPARARIEYEAWLAEFPDAAGAARVQQRLAALTTPTADIEAEASPPVAAAAVEERPDWEVYGSASQYYLRGVALGHDDDEDDFVAQSALLSQAVLFARQSGERFDVASRANFGYLHDFVDDGPGNQALVSYAYVDVTDAKSDVSARVGRQQQQSGGVLGRVDGIHGSYRWRPDLSLHASAGFPVDSPRFRATADHWFYGAGIDVDNVFGAWDFGVFTNLQSIDGIADRQAFGAEAQYHSQHVNVFGMIDYDASYKVINTGFITGNWRINDRLTVHGRYRGGAAPFLTTRNALIGQSVNTVGELFADYSEGQIRRLARNRTAEERAGSAGLSAALTPRLQLKADVAWLEYTETVASGGVAAFPGTGPQLSWGGHLLGSGFFRAGQLLLVGYRHDEAGDADADTVFVDLRQPVGERLRIQSRLDVTQRVANQDPAGDIDQWIASPMLRLAYDWQRRYRIEFEIGGQWSNRKFPPALTPPLIEDDTIEQSDYYLQLGYTVDF